MIKAYAAKIAIGNTPTGEIVVLADSMSAALRLAQTLVAGAANTHVVDIRALMPQPNRDAVLLRQVRMLDQ